MTAKNSRTRRRLPTQPENINFRRGWRARRRSRHAAGVPRSKLSAISAVRRVTYADLHRWKAKPGYNDDWRMTADWVTSLGTAHHL